MLNDLQKSEKAVRNVIGSALCDFIAHLSLVKDPFIIGGQYPNDRLLAAFNKWLSIRKFDITGVNESTKLWLTMCQKSTFSGDKDFETSLPSPSSPPPLPPPPPSPPPVPDSPPSQEDDVIPDEGYFKGEDWKPESEQKKHWTEEGEDWKKEGFNDDELQPC